MIVKMFGKRAILASVLLLGLGFAALPARAGSDVSLGISIGSPYYYPSYSRGYYHHAPAPYYSSTYVYRDRHYGRHYCPPRRHVHQHNYRHDRRYDRDYWRDDNRRYRRDRDRDWDDDDD